MIKIYLLDFTGAEVPEQHLSQLPGFVANTKNPYLRRERIFSYMLLSHALSECGFSDTVSEKFKIPEIKRDENGRPYFENGRAYFQNSDVDFNLSHDKDMAALVISDEGRVGIDIQYSAGKVTDRLIAKVSEIFEGEGFCALMEKEDTLSAQIKFMRYTENVGLTLADDGGYISDGTSGFFSRWTALEAISKADGRGVSHFWKDDLKEDIYSLKRTCVRDKSGNPYALCICKRKNF